MIYFISDTHFGHENFLTFKDEGGERIRKEFDSVQEMDEAMIARWNERVQPGDTIYHLGDVCWGGPAYLDAIMKRLNGRKRLIMGNHDRADVSVYKKYFEIKPTGRYFSTDVTGCNITFILAHIPLHPGSVKTPGRSDPCFCVHGHTHKFKLDDPMYVNVCVENTGYAPRSMEELLQEMRERGS